MKENQLAAFKSTKMSLKRVSSSEDLRANKKECCEPSADHQICVKDEDAIEIDLPVDVKEEIDPLSTVEGSFFELKAVKTESDEARSENVCPVPPFQGYAARNPQTLVEEVSIDVESKPKLNALAYSGSLQCNPSDFCTCETTQDLKIKVEVDEKGLEVVGQTDDVITYSKRENSTIVCPERASASMLLLQGQSGSSAATSRNAPKSSTLVVTGNNPSPVGGAKTLNPIVRWCSCVDEVDEDLCFQEQPPQTNKNEPKSVTNSVNVFSPTAQTPKATSSGIETSSSKDTLEGPEQFSAKAFNPVCVKKLVDHPLSSGSWTVEEKNEILLQPIPLSDQTTSGKSEHLSFSSFDFSEFPWLCDSPELKKFYCWPCLLIGRQAVPWSMDMTPLSSSPCSINYKKAFTIHKATLMHHNSYNIYLSRKKLASSWKALHNIKTLWRDFVQTLCREMKKNPRFKLENDPSLTAHVQNIMMEMFHQRMPPNYAVALSEKILNLTRQNIKSKIFKDLRNSPFLTLHVEDFALFSEDRSWLVVVARYTDKDGCAKEIVVDFIRADLSKSARSAKEVIGWFMFLFDVYNVQENVVGFSHSASIVLPKDISKFHQFINSYCPRAMFYHPPNQHLFRSMFQAISCLIEFRRFFNEINDMCIFLNNNPSVVQNKVDTALAPLPKRFDITIATSLKKHYSTLLKIFQRMVNLEKCRCSMKDKGKQYVRFLKGQQNCILIVLASLICSTCADFAEALDSHSEVELLTELRDKAINTLRAFLEQGLKGIVVTVEDPALAKVVVNPKYDHLFGNVIQLTIDFLTQTFENLEHFTYTNPGLLNFTVKLTKYPIQSLDFAERIKLRQIEFDQLKLLVRMPDPPQFIQTMNHTQLLEFLTVEKQTQQYAGLYAYLQFVHTVTVVSSERRFLLNSVLDFIAKASGDQLNLTYLRGYRWTIDDVFSSVMNDPDLYRKAFSACSLKLVENEYDVKIVSLNDSL